MKWSMLFSHNLYTWNFHASMCGCAYSMTSLLHILLKFSHNYSWWCDSNMPLSLLYLYIEKWSGAKKNPSSFINWRMTHFLIHFRFVLTVAYSSFQCVCCFDIGAYQVTSLFELQPRHWKISIIGGIGFLLLNLVKNTQRLPKSVNWLQLSDLMLLPIALFQLCNQLYRLHKIDTTFTARRIVTLWSLSVFFPIAVHVTYV